MSKLFFLRHGESSGNIHFRINPDNPVATTANHLFELSETGCNQVQKSGLWLRQNYGEQLLSHGIAFASTFKRTQQTCSIVFPDCHPVVDSRLNEHWRGIWHTMSKEDRQKFYPQEDQIRERDGWYHYRAPGGQSCQDVEALIYSLILDLQINYKNKPIVLFGHGNWQVLFRRIIENKTVAEALIIQEKEFPPNASISIWDIPISGNFKEAKLELLNFAP